MNCIVIGLSNFGIALAQRLTNLGHEVLGIDKDIDKINEYQDSIKNTISLNINNREAIRTLPLKDADIVFVAIRKDVGASVMAVATLKENGVKRIVACSISELHSTILKAMGITEIVRPEKEYADFFALKIELTTSVYSYMVTNNYFIYEMKLPAPFIGRQLGDVEFEKNLGLKLIAIKHPLQEDGHSKIKTELIDKPDNDFVIGPEDVFILAGHPHNFQNLME